MVNPRAPLNRLTATVAVAVLVLSLVLSGSGGVAAQAPDPNQYGPATPEELQALERAAQNIGAPETPIFEGGYPASMPEPAEVTAASAVDAWSANWAVGALCSGNEECLVGDFDGDGKDDVAVLYRDTRAEPQRGDVMVALSKGLGFKAAVKWTEFACTGGQLCKAGDVNNDGKDDLVIFNHGSNEASGQVYVALSTGTGFQGATVWQNLFCLQYQVCAVGNVDGVNGDDIILFRRSSETGGGIGDVNVARSNGANAFGNSEKWHEYFCLNDEECRVADLNGDNVDDIVAFVKTGTGAGRVAVAISTRYSFATASDWATGFCSGSEQCELGDFDATGTDDVLKFVRGGSGGTTFGDVYVRLSTGSGLGDQQRWHDSFCFPGEDCGVGDFDGDQRTDVIRFVKSSLEPTLVGAAYVALGAGTPYGFVPTPAPSGKWLDGFCKNAATCTTGDFNGDGLTDIVYFVRDTQTGAGRGDVFVALNQNGVQFGYPMLWQDFTCVGTDICKVGDVDKDGRDDLIVFSRVQNGYVYVSRSTGSSFLSGEIWNTLFCIGAEVCDVGDFNGDGLADLVLFTRSTYGANDRAGDVEVAINTGRAFIGTGVWHTFFCVGSESCQTGDFNGDGKDDIVTFSKGSDAKVWIELSNGYQFGDKVAPAELWQSFFCGGSEVCDVGDANGDGRDDVLAFLQGGYPSVPVTYGDVYVGVSQGSQVAGGFTSQKWSDYFCIAGEICDTGYFNSDNRKDIIAFSRGSAGNVYVGLANSGTGYFFSDAIPYPPGAKLIYLPWVSR